MKLLQIIGLILLVSCSLISNNTEKEAKTKKKPAKDENLCVCVEIYAPVCGTNKITYANSCLADCDKVKYSTGACR